MLLIFILKLHLSQTSGSEDELFSDDDSSDSEIGRGHAMKNLDEGMIPLYFVFLSKVCI